MSPRLTAAIATAVGISCWGWIGAAFQENGKEERPSLRFSVSPKVSFAPTEVFLRVELSGGLDDYEAFYCPDVEWEWGDGTTSEASYDCDPYEAGTSEIRRRYAVQHLFRYSGEYEVEFKLKQNDDVVGNARTTVSVRPGVREGIPHP